MWGEPLPPRTVPDEILGFSCRTYMAGDSDDRYPNVHGVHPAEFKVELTVSWQQRSLLVLSLLLLVTAIVVAAAIVDAADDIVSASAAVGGHHCFCDRCGR